MKNWLKTFIIEHTLIFKQISFLHPEGKSMPNGICYQRGHYCQVCAENAHKFTIRNNDGEDVVPPSNRGWLFSPPVETLRSLITRKEIMSDFKGIAGAKEINEHSLEFDGHGATFSLGE